MTRQCRLWPIVFVLASACSSSAPTAPSGGLLTPPQTGVTLSPALETEVVTIMNRLRSSGTTCGTAAQSPVPALVMNENLRTAAREHSIDMVNRHFFSHTTPEGKTFQQRIQESGYEGAPLGEILAAGQTTPQAAVDSWLPSNGHCRIIMDAQARSIGVGFANNHWTAKFGG